MDDRELDDLLLQASGTTEAPAVAAATRDVVARARAQHRPRPHRRLLLGGAIVAAALALTAGTTVTAYYLRIPPFIGLDAGSIRTQGNFPLDYVSDEGNAVSCRIFLEFKGVDAADVGRLDTAIAATDWSTWGQDIYDGLADPMPQPSAAANLNPQEDVTAAYEDEVYDFARVQMPGLVRLAPGAGAPELSAIATTCIPYKPGAATSQP